MSKINKENIWCDIWCVRRGYTGRGSKEEKGHGKGSRAAERSNSYIQWAGKASLELGIEGRTCVRS